MKGKALQYCELTYGISLSIGEVYILSSSKSMTQTHNGKLYKIIDPKRWVFFNILLSQVIFS